MPSAPKPQKQEKNQPTLIRRRRTKFNAKPSFDLATGRSFDSQVERRRWNELEMLEKGAVISDLVFKPAPIILDSEAGIKWQIDYTYTEKGRTVWEDCKPRPLTRAESLLIRMWKVRGPGLLRITGWKNNRGHTIKEILSAKV